MAIVELLINLIFRFGQILAAPLKNPDMLWILVPIYINWIATDYFQERKGTDFGNAITNGIVTLWVGVDWIRQTSHNFQFSLSFFTKILLCVFIIIYSLIIIVECAKAKKIAHYIGRVREVSYFMIVLTPIIYGVINVDFITIGAILLFFPIWYLIGEIIDRALPPPPGEEQELENMPELKDLPSEVPSLPEEVSPKISESVNVESVQKPLPPF
ncbi:MAG: hypothetical protein QXQ79_02215 [Candidatus Nanoarchaeia archaeon]